MLPLQPITITDAEVSAAASAHCDAVITFDALLGIACNFGPHFAQVRAALAASPFFTK